MSEYQDTWSDNNSRMVVQINDRYISDINLNVRFLNLIQSINNNMDEVAKISDMFYELISCLNAFEIKLFIIREGKDKLNCLHKIPGEWLKIMPISNLTKEEKLVNSAISFINTLIDDKKIKELIDIIYPMMQTLNSIMQILNSII